MKKITILLVGSIVLSTMIFSCKKKDDSPEPAPTTSTYEVVDKDTTYAMGFYIDFTMVGQATGESGDQAYQYYIYSVDYDIIDGDVSQYGLPDYNQYSSLPTQTIQVYYQLNYMTDSIEYTIENTSDQTASIKNLIVKEYIRDTRLYTSSGRLLYFVKESEYKNAIGRSIPAKNGEINGKLNINIKNDYTYSLVDTYYNGAS